MPRVCSVCSHPYRKQIDGAIVEGVSRRDIARQFAVGHDAVSRHAEKHLPATLLRATEAAEVTHADDLLADIRKREQRADALGALAARNQDYRVALQALREWRGLAEFRAKVAGQLDERAVVNVIMSPQWMTIRGVLIDALRNHPEARLAVVEALSRVEGAESHGGR